jgi:hypothetical protein
MQPDSIRDAYISASAMIVTYPGTGPSICDRIFRVPPAVAAGGPLSAEASVAEKPVAAHIAPVAKPQSFVVSA